MKQRIFELVQDLNFDGFNFVDVELFWELRIGGLEALTKFPTPIPVELNTDEVYATPPSMPDYVWVTPSVCCFSAKAWSLVNRSLVIRGPFVELAYRTGGAVQQFILFKPRIAFDCLNLQRSRGKFFLSSPRRVAWIEEITLKNVAAVDEDIFAVKDLSWTMFCTERCRRVVEENKLTGFCFKPVATRDS